MISRRNAIRSTAAIAMSAAVSLDRAIGIEPVRTEEPIIEPALPIIDAHHHLWDRRPIATPASARASPLPPSIMRRMDDIVQRHRQKYLLEEFLADANTGHDIRATVFCEAHSMYRAGGPPEQRCIGEVEFVNGIAAMAASGTYGQTQVCAAIVGSANLLLGEEVEPILHIQSERAADRFAGIRASFPYDPDPRILGAGGQPNMLADRRFRAGLAVLERLGLTFDTFVVEPQLPELVEVARARPGLQIILNHCGQPLGVGAYEGKREERFPIWRENMRKLAECGNVAVKLGGLGLPIQGFKSWNASPSFTSRQLADEWRPYIESCIELFGADKCMFESDYPPDCAVGSYATIWNAFKRIAAGCSADEKALLFAGSARRIYKIRTA